MKRSGCIPVIIGLVVCAIFATPILAQTMGVSGGHDLDALWRQAQRQLDTSADDALLLLESRHITVSTDGDLRTRVHRLVWIGTEVGIEEHADLRIPYDSATSTFTVTALRTWRDGRWWPDAQEISATAVVETLPFAMAQADDYTSMRETMLLHDGVELPCIMETAYEIVERGAAADGRDDLWVFPQGDPAVLVEYILTVPAGTKPSHRSGNGAPEPAVTAGNDETVTYAWKMENVARAGSPRIADPAVHEPYVTWSTWPDWSTLGRKIVAGFDRAAVLSEALADTVAERLRREPSLASKGRKIAALVNEYARGIHYDTRFWRFSPRPATRTWETAYGHPLDRAVLAAAMFRAAGFGAEPVYFSRGTGLLDPGIPGLSSLGTMNVFVDFKNNTYAVYDPADGRLSGESHHFFDRYIWRPGAGGNLAARPAPGGSPDISRFELILTLEPDKKEGSNGTGFLHADGIFCPYDEMAGLHGEALAHIGGVVSSVLPETDVDGYNPEVFSGSMVTAGFDLTAKPVEADDQGLMRIVIGDPAGGIIAGLPPDVRLYHERRDTPVLLPGNAMQRVKLRIKTGEREIVLMPEPRSIENAVGRYTLRVENDDGWVTVERELTLKSTTVDPPAWPLLRALLLEETDAAGRTILMK